MVSAKNKHPTIDKFKIGDNVLVKQKKHNKLTPLFDPHPYTIVDKKGSMVTAQRQNHQIVRNSSFYKPIHGLNNSQNLQGTNETDDDSKPVITERKIDSQIPASVPEEIPSQLGSTPQRPTNKQCATQDNETRLQSPHFMEPISAPTPNIAMDNLSQSPNQPETSKRPVRQRKPPGYLKDYVSK